MAEEKRPLPPYVPVKTFHTFLETLNPPPEVIDRSVWGYRISGALGSQAMHAMRYLGFADLGNRLTETGREYLQSDEQGGRQILRTALLSAYPWLFDGSIDLESTTSQQLNAKFKAQGADGKVLEQAVRFFTSMAREAGIDLSAHLGRTRRTSTERTGRPSPTRRKRQPTRRALTPTSERERLLDKLVDKFPPFDPNWAPEVQKAWLDRWSELYGRVAGEEIASPGGTAEEQVEE